MISIMNKTGRKKTASVPMDPAAVAASNGHAVFWIMHGLAVIFISPLLLFLTIPTHVIYSAIVRTK